MAAGDDNLLWEAMEGLAAMSPRLWRLKSLCALLPRHLKVELETWIEGGPVGHCFDHATDSLVLSTFTAFEMGELLRDTRVARATLEYLFRRIDRAMVEDPTRPTLIYVEEACQTPGFLPGCAIGSKPCPNAWGW
jgi:type IV secretory pathway VirB4 component